VCLITSGQPSANPRIVKEATRFAIAGLRVVVIYVPLSTWADEFDKKIFNENANITWIRTGYHPKKDILGYKFARLRRKLYAIGFKYFRFALNVPEYGYALFAKELKKSAIKIQADLYVAHNLGALPAAALASKRWHAEYCFDAEDYHRGETKQGSLQNLLTIAIEDKYLPKVKHFTAASPLIAEAYKAIFPEKQFTLINNVFSKKFLQPVLRHEPNILSLFWFSQTIGKNRGLEDIIQALKQCEVTSFRLTLLGNCSREIKKYFTDLASIDGSKKVAIFFLDAVCPDKVFEIASRHDIGLSLEPGRDRNNQFALSNKVFAYLLAGNAVIFSSTPAQQLFFEENPGIGFLYTCGNIKELSYILKHYSENSELVEEHKKNASRLASSKYNWEIESEKLMTITNSALKDA
jgi:glycosyltransferase involved in cell wall biosynthesis